MPSECVLPGLCPELLGQACRIFLKLAYPGGESSIPVTKRAYLHVAVEPDLEPLLKPPVCQVLPRLLGLDDHPSPDPLPGPARGQGERSGIRGYAFRLGSSVFPHLKLQVVGQSDGELVFSVDTHDQVRVPANHPDAAAWALIQTSNRKLKEEIEHSWEAAGLLTFNALLRRELGK